MSSGPASQDSSLSAATFLASISADSTVAFEPGTSSSAPGSAPALPISAKVSLIDAQIDALEGQAEKEVIAHAEELRARATSTRAVDHDLNRLWLSINQTSSRLVTVGPQVAPKAIEYHDALAQSSKQALLLSVLSDLLAATRLLERLEKLQTQSDPTALRSELPKVAQVMEPFRFSASSQKYASDRRAREAVRASCTRPAQKQPQRLPEPPTPHHSRLSHLLQTWQSQREVL